MAIRENLQNKVVTGGKFVTVGSSVSASRQALRNIASSINELDNSVIQNRLDALLSNGITPEEKEQFLAIWDELDSGFNRLSATVYSLGMQDDSNWQTLIEMRSSVQIGIQRIRESSGTIDIPNFSDLISRYSSFQKQFAIDMVTNESYYRQYTVEASCYPKAPIPGEELTLVCRVFDGSYRIVSEADPELWDKLKQTSPEWIITRTQNDTGFSVESGWTVTLSGEQTKELFREVDAFTLSVLVTLPTPS